MHGARGWRLLGPTGQLARHELKEPQRAVRPTRAAPVAIVCGRGRRNAALRGATERRHGTRARDQPAASDSPKQLLRAVSAHFVALRATLSK